VSPHGRRVRLFFRLHKDININAVLTLEFLEQLKPHITGRCIVVWDRLRTHKAKIVHTMIVSQSRLLMEYFPPYAPELNPVEYVWIRCAKIDAHFPSILRNVDSDIDMLTAELDFGTFRTHGKPSFGCGTLLADTTIYALKPGLLKHTV
jgi:transposase